MEILPECFFIFTCIGLWKPAGWAGYKSIAYNVYTVLMISIPSLFVISGFLDLILLTTDVSDISDNVFLVLTIMAGCAKMFNIILNRNMIFYIINCLQNKPLRPQDDEEIIIKNRYHQISRFITFSYSTMTGVGVTLFVLGKLIENGPQRILPYRGWLPYNYSQPVVYWLSAGQQATSMIIAGGVNAAFDTFFPGMMFLVCAQINIFKHRFKIMLNTLEISDYNNNNIADNHCRKINYIFGESVKHHNYIFQLFDNINNVFSTVIFVQYSVGSVIFCTSIYHMSDIKITTVEFVSNIFYIGSMLSQIFLLCVSANQVTLEFEDLNTALYDSKWFTVNNSARKCLIIMMINSQKHITFTTGYIVTLSLDSFTSLVKLSYTIYNVLQQS
ncbi:odorant receptor 2a-like isoform X1 [Microplitis mediator]|uniref:odorant receptor 2a-like isoform X1 n=2 Tax=Microplitis mediator TaxID=375433 RepID=UPI002554C92C|nr:odorant receptor 2a-like isoform X1 [Microplitis mediator]